MLRPEQKCEASVDYRTVQKPVSRIFYDFEGRKHDLGPDVQDKPGINEVEIDCNKCALHGVVFQAEGNGPYGATNAIRNKTAEFISENCVKFQRLKASGLREVTSDFLPKL